MSVLVGQALMYTLLFHFCLVVFVQGANIRGKLPYVPEDHGGMMRYIPKYDKAGNKMGKKWWQPLFSLAGTPPPWQPYQKSEVTEFTNPAYHPGKMKIENWDMPAVQTWPTPIVTGEPGHEQEPGKKYDLKGPESPDLMKPHESRPGMPSASQMPYPTYNLRTVAMPMKEDYLRMAPDPPKDASEAAGKSGNSPQGGQPQGGQPQGGQPQPQGGQPQGGQPQGAPASSQSKPGQGGSSDPSPPQDPAGHPTQPKESGYPIVFLEAQPRNPMMGLSVHPAAVGVHPAAVGLHPAALAVHPIGQVVATANLDDGVHTVAHPALAGVHFGASSNPYKSIQPSAVAFGTNPLAYHPNAVVNHPSQIGAAAVAQTKVLYGMPPPKPEVITHHVINPMYPHPLVATHVHPNPMAVAAGGETALKEVAVAPWPHTAQTVTYNHVPGTNTVQPSLVTHVPHVDVEKDSSSTFLELKEAAEPGLVMPFSSPYPLVHGHMGQVVATANLDEGVHTVAHPALAGVHFGAGMNPYKAIKPSAVAFGTNPLAYHPNAVVNHPSQIGASAVAQTKVIYGSNPQPEILSLNHPAGAVFAGVHHYAGVHPYAGTVPYAGYPYAGVTPYIGTHLGSTVIPHPTVGGSPIAVANQAAFAHPAALPALLSPKMLPTIESIKSPQNRLHPLPVQVYPHHLPQAHNIELPWFPSFGFVNPGEMVPAPIVYEEKGDRLKALGLKESSVVPGSYQVDHRNVGILPQSALTGFGNNWAAAARASHPVHPAQYVPLTGFLPWHPSTTIYNPAKDV